MKHLTRQEKKCQKERRALMAELDAATQALRANEKAFQEALDPFVIEQLTYQHAALRCRSRVPLTDTLWPWAVGAVCLLLVLRCAARQRHPVLAVLAGAVCGLGVLAVMALLEPVSGIALPLNRYTAFVAAVLGVPGVVLLLLLQLIL